MHTQTKSLERLSIAPEDPAIACSLNGAELAARLRSTRLLGERALVAVEAGADRARLTFNGAAAAVEDFVNAEQSCCGFLQFQTTERAGLIELEISAPAGGESSLRGIVAALVAGWEGGL